MPDVVFTPTIEPMPAIDNVELGLMMQTEPDFLIASGADDLVVESSGYSLTFSPEPTSVTFDSFVGLGDESVWYCPTLETLEPWSDLSSVFNLDLTPYNASVTSDPGGDAYTFTGSSSSYATNNARVTNLTEFSYSFWVKGPASSSEVAGVVSQSEFNNFRGSLVGSYQNSSQGGDGSKVHFFYQSNPTSYNSAERLQSIATVFDSTWHHVVVTFQGGSRVNIYVDGVLDRTTSSSVPSQVSDVWKFELGRYAGSNAFAGSLDDVRVFTRAITATEAAWLSTYRGILGEPAPPPVGLGDEKLWLCPTHSNSAMDLSGNGNNGTYQGGMGTVFDSGAGGARAYDFDGTDNYVSIPDSSSLRIDNPSGISICAWVRPDTISGGDSFSSTNPRYIIKKGALPDSFNYAFRLIGGKVSFTYRNSTDTAYTACIQDVASVVASSWQHVAVSGNSGGYKIYVNGSEVASTKSGTLTDSPVQDSGPCELGRQDTTQRMFDGLQDDIRVYDRPLTSDEITHLATARGVQGSPCSGLGDEKLWLCPTHSNSAMDLSGNGNNGTYQGGMGTVFDSGAGGARAYDHSTGSSSIRLPSDLGISGDTISLSIWLENDVVNTGGSVDQWLGAYNSVNSQSNPIIYQFGTDLRGADKNENPNTTISASFPITTSGTWRHVVIVADGSSGEYRLYENGSLKDTQSAGGSDMTIKTSLDWYVGAGNGWVSALGKSDDIRVYGRPLTSDEITHLATARGVQGPPVSGYLDPFANPVFQNQFFSSKVIR